MYPEDRIASKVSLDMIQALILLKLVTTKKNNKKNMEGGNMEGNNIAEITETPTVIDLFIFWETAQLKPIWLPIFSLLVYFYLCVYCFQKQQVYPAGAKAVPTD